MNVPGDVAQLQRQIRQNSDELNQFVQGVHDWQKQCENRRPADSKNRSGSLIADTPKNVCPLFKLTKLQVSVNDIRERGNVQFRAGQYAASARTYSECLEHAPDDAKALANRAAAYLKLGRHADAEQDCTAALAQDARNVKVLLRRGTARASLRKIQSAILDFEAVIKIAGAGTSPAEIAQKHVETLRVSQRQPKALSSAQLPESVRDLPRRRLEIEVVSDSDDYDDNRR